MNTAATGTTDGLATILVTCCGQLEYTRLCAPSLLRYSRAPFELVFLDNDGLDGTAEYLEGFAAAAPVRVEVARVPAEPPLGPGRKDDVIPLHGEFVALLNNDTIVTQGWLERLMELASTAADVGMVAPMSNHGLAPLGVGPVPYGIEALGDDGPGGGRGNPWGPIERVNRFARQRQEQSQGPGIEMETLSGACALLKRTVLQKLGLFPTRTPLGTFDMDALSGRVRQAGFRLLGCRAAFIHDFASRRTAR